MLTRPEDYEGRTRLLRRAGAACGRGSWSWAWTLHDARVVRLGWSPRDPERQRVDGASRRLRADRRLRVRP